MTAAPTSQVTAAVTAQDAEAQLVSLARVDPVAFIEYVLKDERTGVAVRCPPMHVEWHRLIDRHPRLVIHSFVESAKSNSVTIARTLYELGRDPSLRVAILSNTQPQAAKLLGSVARYIEQSAELRAVFPGLVKAAPWGASAITVQRRTISKDASVQAIGVHGAVLGSRLDLVIVDDVLDFENVRTEEQRNQLVQWFESTILGRVVAGGRVLVLGSAWHPQDLMFRLKERQGWHHERFGVADEYGVPRWPERWPASRIAAKRQELGALEAARQLDVVARDEGTSRFREDWIAETCKRGFNKPMLGHLLSCPAPAFVTVGVDLAVSTKRNADLTAISVVLSHGPGGNARRELLCVESGRWDAPTIIRSIIAMNQRYLPSLVVVEGVAAQRYIAQMIRGAVASVPVKDFITGRGRQSIQWQAETLAVEMQRGQWTFRGDGTGELAGLVRDLLYYSPNQHPGDRLVSLLLARWGSEQAALRAESLPGLDFNRR